VYGHVVSAQKAGQGRNPSIELEVDTIRFANGTKSSLSASIAKIQAKHLNVVAGAAGAGAGLLLGNWIGKSIGIKGGGLFGAAAGFLLASNNKQNIALPAGSQVSAVLSSSLAVP
jgi:outer membrane lipoprotein SlyB